MLGWANTKKSETACNYRQYDQVIPFLLEFFLNFGLGHFLIRSLWVGTLKMIILLIIPAILCTILFALHFFKTSLWWWTTSFFIIIAFIWWIVDAILFGTNYYYDGNSVPLLPW